MSAYALFVAAVSVIKIERDGIENKLTTKSIRIIQLLDLPTISRVLLKFFIR